MESIIGEDAGDIIEMTTEYLEYYIILVDKAVTGLEKVDSNYEKLSKIILEAKANGQDPYDECLNWWKNRNNKDTILSDFFTE